MPTAAVDHAPASARAGVDCSRNAPRSTSAYSAWKHSSWTQRRGHEHHEPRQRLRHDELRAEHADEEPDQRLREAADADDAAGQRVLDQPADGAGQQPADRRRRQRRRRRRRPAPGSRAAVPPIVSPASVVCSSSAPRARNHAAVFISRFRRHAGAGPDRPAADRGGHEHDEHFLEAREIHGGPHGDRSIQP